MNRKIAELILIAAVVGIVYTDKCVYSQWKRGDCNCRSKSIPITRAVLTGGKDCKDKLVLKEPCNCGTYRTKTLMKHHLFIFFILNKFREGAY